jgi:hypothetical protein
MLKCIVKSKKMILMKTSFLEFFCKMNIIILLLLLSKKENEKKKKKLVLLSLSFGNPREPNFPVIFFQKKLQKMLKIVKQTPIQFDWN